MKKFQTTFMFLLLSSSIFFSNAQSDLKERLEQHVYTLASDSLQGRKAGTEDARKASEYITNQWNEIGIQPFEHGNYLQNFNDNKYHNLVGVIPGNDPILKNEYIIVGAHYDHLGVKNGQIYNGADDNASGVATLIELGRELKQNQTKLKRSVILIAFDAEEIGLLGSGHFIKSTDIPIQNIRLMISVDMVGWYKQSGEVKYIGSATIKNGKSILENPKLVPVGLNVVTKNFEKSILTATDTQPFAEKGIPTLAVTTGIKSPYHKPEDDADLIDYDGMTLITEHLRNLVEAVSMDKNYQTSGRIAKKHRSNQLFTIGITGNLGSNYHYYTQGAVDGKHKTSSGAGVMMQMNLGNFAIRPEVYYDRINAKHPDGAIYTDNLTLPLSIVLQSNQGGAGADLFLGGYYSYRLSGKQDNINLDFENTFNRNEFGLMYGFGFFVKPFKIGFANRTAFTNFTKLPNSVNAHIKNRASFLMVSYLF